MVHFTGLLENARHPGGGPCWGTLMGGPRKNRLPAGIRGWAGTATGGHIRVVHISHTHPPKEIIQALRKYLLGKNRENETRLLTLVSTQPRKWPVNVWQKFLPSTRHFTIAVYGFKRV